MLVIRMVLFALRSDVAIIVSVAAAVVIGALATLKLLLIMGARERTAIEEELRGLAERLGGVSFEDAERRAMLLLADPAKFEVSRRTGDEGAEVLARLPQLARRFLAEYDEIAALPSRVDTIGRKSLELLPDGTGARIGSGEVLGDILLLWGDERVYCSWGDAPEMLATSVFHFILWLADPGGSDSHGSGS